MTTKQCAYITCCFIFQISANSICNKNAQILTKQEIETGLKAGKGSESEFKDPLKMENLDGFEINFKTCKVL